MQEVFHTAADVLFNFYQQKNNKKQSKYTEYDVLL